jgi:hypothetical protein
MAMFNSYVELPEGKWRWDNFIYKWGIAQQTTCDYQRVSPSWMILS